MYIIAVHKIKRGQIFNAGPHWVFATLANGVPAHMRYLESVHTCVGAVKQLASEAPDISREQSQALRRAFFAAFEQHLFTDTYPEQWFVAADFKDNLNEPGLFQGAHAVAHR